MINIGTILTVKSKQTGNIFDLKVTDFPGDLSVVTVEDFPEDDCPPDGCVIAGISNDDENDEDEWNFRVAPGTTLTFMDGEGYLVIAVDGVTDIPVLDKI